MNILKNLLRILKKIKGKFIAIVSNDGVSFHMNKSIQSTEFHFGFLINLTKN